MNNFSLPFLVPNVFMGRMIDDNGLYSKLIVSALLFIAIAVFLSGAKKNGPLPPGPRGLPLVGNIFQLSEDAWHQFTEWKHTYSRLFYIFTSFYIIHGRRCASTGPIIHLNLFGQSVIVLSSNKVAADLLDRRAAIYSDRPRFIIACGMLTERLFFTFSRYGDT